MDLFNLLSKSSNLIQTVGMHTCGEPTRIVIKGFPSLEGSTLLAKRAAAKSQHDALRKRLMLEPRGHQDMYGAILVPETEIEEAHIGVLFCHNEGFSTMCGHATIALGRFLVDTHDPDLFPRSYLVTLDKETKIASLKLHAPCGLVQVFVPTIPLESSPFYKSDPSKPVAFISVPSFVAARNITIDIPSTEQWPMLFKAGKTSVTFDISYGGAFYALVKASELGFEHGLEGCYTLEQFNTATRVLKRIIQDTASLNGLIQHPHEPDLGFLYSVIVVDERGDAIYTTDDANVTAELGLCFFANQQIDRSPTGSGVCARVALAVAADDLALNEPRDYHSIVSVKGKRDHFRGMAVEKTVVEGRGKHSGRQWDAVLVRVEGYAYYTDCSSFVWEQEDTVSKDGFQLDLPHSDKLTRNTMTVLRN